MLEKLLLASILTFTFSLFADIGSPKATNISKDTHNTPVQDNVVFSLTQAFHNQEIKSED
jgi:hypothetical protein